MSNFSVFCNLPYGAQRREQILLYLAKSKYKIVPEFWVNRKYCIQTKRDPDIKYLLKKKKIKQVRVQISLFTSYSKLELA